MTECVIFGGLLLDKYYEIEALPRKGQDAYINSEKVCVGGCAVNMAATFNNLGGTSHVVSYIGEDKDGQIILDYMKKYSLSDSYIRRSQGDTGYCMVFLEKDGERTFLTKKGIELNFNKSIFEDGFNGIEHALVTGYYLLENTAEEIVEVLEDFVKKGGTVLFDPSPLVDEIDKAVLKRVIKLSRILTPNTSEIQTIVKAWGNCEDEPDTKQLEKWMAECGKTVILKEGQKGGTVYSEGKAFRYEAAEAHTVDTTGAGDSFAAGIMYGTVKGYSLQDSVMLAALTSAKTVTINGPHGFWKPSEKMLDIMKKYK